MYYVVSNILDRYYHLMKFVSVYSINFANEANVFIDNSNLDKKLTCFSILAKKMIRIFLKSYLMLVV